MGRRDCDERRFSHFLTDGGVTPDGGEESVDISNRRLNPKVTRYFFIFDNSLHIVFNL